MADKKTTRSAKAAPKTKQTAKAQASEKTIDQMRIELATKQADLATAKRGHRLGELTNPHVLTVSRKEIARLHSAIQAAKIAEEKRSK